MILTLTDPGDEHAFLVQEALRAKGFDATHWYGADLAQRMAVSVESGPEGIRFAARGPELDLDGVAPRVVWLRRPAAPVPPEGLHPADLKWARREYEEFHRWLIRGLPENAFWINPLDAARRARSKLEQQRVALRVGLLVPPTLYSNDPEAIRAFVRNQGGDAVYKPLGPTGFWQIGDDTIAALFTSRLAEEHLADDDALRATPGIFQPRLEKSHELRVTVIGRRIFAARVDSQSMATGRLDWRRSLDEMAGFFAPIDLAPDLDRAILGLMDELGLVFGCLDFIVTPAGESLFLEVNEMGQFLFIEQFTEIPLLDAFCEMLIQGRPDYSWDPARVAVRMADFVGRIDERRKQAHELHVPLPQEILGEEPGASAEDPSPAG